MALTRKMAIFGKIKRTKDDVDGDELGIQIDETRNKRLRPDDYSPSSSSSSSSSSLIAFPSQSSISSILSPSSPSSSNYSSESSPSSSILSNASESIDSGIARSLSNFSSSNHLAGSTRTGTIPLLRDLPDNQEPENTNRSIRTDRRSMRNPRSILPRIESFYRDSPILYNMPTFTLGRISPFGQIDSPSPSDEPRASTPPRLFNEIPNLRTQFERIIERFTEETNRINQLRAHLDQLRQNFSDPDPLDNESDSDIDPDKKWSEEVTKGSAPIEPHVKRASNNIVDYIVAKRTGNFVAKIDSQFGLTRMICQDMIKEKQFSLQQFNKVFCSHWLTERQVVFGTKCNKLVVLDLETGKMDLIPCLKGSSLLPPPENQGGIHSIALNPNKTLLATGGENPNDLAVYKLPTMDPFCVGEKAHTDWIFDCVWLDDQVVATGSRDTSIALWKINSDASQADECYPNYQRVSPFQRIVCENAQKIRALVFNDRIEKLVALSLDAQLHEFDPEYMTVQRRNKVPHGQENVCLAQNEEKTIYAVGSKSHTSFFDTRDLRPFHNLASKYHGCGIRSITFNSHLVTIGTGVGAILFYDIRNRKYLEKGNSKHAVLKATKGYVYPDDHEFIMNIEYSPAIYTHQYDVSRTRIFAAGGPLPASLHGSYSALWM